MWTAYVPMTDEPTPLRAVPAPTTRASPHRVQICRSEQALSRQLPEASARAARWRAAFVPIVTGSGVAATLLSAWPKAVLTLVPTITHSRKSRIHPRTVARTTH